VSLDHVDWSAIGVWLLIGSAVLIVIEGAIAGVWSARLARRAKALQQRLVEEQGRLEADVERLRLALAETVVLWQPYARLLRWLRHPLAIALLQSFARRRAGAR
jgi:hypothetical protein